MQVFPLDHTGADLGLHCWWQMASCRYLSALLCQASNKDHWHRISLPPSHLPSFSPVLHCGKKLDPLLKAKHFRMKFFWSQNCLCDYRQIDTLWCLQPAHPAGTGNDAIHAALTLTGPREATASLTRKMLSISSAGWLCPVIVMLARLWHLCYVDGKCLSHHLLTAQFKFSSTLMDSSWRIIIKKMKSFLTLNATAAATPWRCPTVLLTKAVDSHTVSPFKLLPFSSCVTDQRLNLTAFLIVVERPGERPRPFSDLNNTQTPCPPLCPGSGTHIHVRE